MQPSSLEILPQPFAWIPISAGKVEVVKYTGPDFEHHNEIFQVTPFEIAKYPITNAQFTKFVQAKGYSQRQWWTDAGWQAKIENHWVEPYYWQDSNWNESDYPVVGVSWYEAAAFCLWLSDVTQESINLPTEQQWQRAAQGDTNWVFPWGPGPGIVPEKQDYCNWGSDREKTTPVTQYEGKGDSPFGVVDMNGNVWEYCCTKFDTDENDLAGAERRVARGGGWIMFYSYIINIGNTTRATGPSHFRDNYTGFRLSRS